MTPDERIELYQVLRNVRWRYQLDSRFEDPAVANVLEYVGQARSEIIDNLGGRLDISLDSKWTDRRNAELLEQLNDLTVGLKDRLGADVGELATVSFEKSVEAHNSIMSLRGAASNVQMLQLSPDQIQSFLETPVGGRQLHDWVNRTFDYPLQERLSQELGTGLFRGESYRKLRDRIDQALGEAAENSETLVRSWVQSANVNAQRKVQQANKDIVKGWSWNSVLENADFGSGTGTCLRCMSLSSRGEIYPIDGGPDIPLHPNCFTPDTSIFAPDKVSATVASYDGPVLEIGFSNGARFTVTPNHMLLTPNGMVPAHALRKGSNVFYNPKAQGIVSGGPNDNWSPARIDEAVESFSKSRFMVTRSVPRSAEQLHGDGKFINGNVDIIAPTSLLRGDYEAMIDEFGYEYPFISSDVSTPESLVGKGGLLSGLWWLRLATNSGMCSHSVSDVLFPGSFIHHNSIGSGIASDIDFVACQNSSDNISRHIEGFCDGVFGLTGDIPFANLRFRQRNFGLYALSAISALNKNSVPFEDGSYSGRMSTNILSDFVNRHSGLVKIANVEFIRERHFCGHVYDLQTFSTMYHSEGIIASNCRCVAIPVTKSYKELGLDVPEIDNALENANVRGTVDPLTGQIKRGKTGVGGQPLLSTQKVSGGFDEFMATLPEQVQRDTLGPQRFKLWKQGKIKLEDLATTSGRQKTIKELK